MRILALTVWTLLHLLVLGLAASCTDFAFPIDHSLVHNYSRFTEIQKHCNAFISLASELESDNSGISKLKNELSFFNGDWEQASRGATLMPFDDSDMPQGRSSFISPWKVVSFEVEDVSSGAAHQPKNTMSISGVLSIGITRNSTVISEPGVKFQKRPGMSALRVDFEGVYLETEENGGERLLCLLGNSTFAFKKGPFSFADDYMTSYFDVSDTYNEEPLILPHDRISLVLSYPKTSSSSTGRIHGEMTSLYAKEDLEYFDKVHITSHLAIFPRYHASSSKELSFYQNPLQDAIVEDGVNKFNNSEFCNILKYFEHEVYRVMPNLKLGGQNWFQDTVGPFLLGKEIQLVDRNNGNLRVIMHHIICKEEKVSGVLRMYPATIPPHVAARRTGLSTLTLSVEGTWNPSTGLLSMKGCLGPELAKCDSGVLFYFPKSFSNKHRSVISGSIFSMEDTRKVFQPVFIQLEMLSPGLHKGGWYSSSYLSYNYSKTDSAIEFRERGQEPQWISYIRRSLFQYHALEEEDENFKISNSLADDLSISTFTSLETFVKVEVLSLGSLFRTHYSSFYQVSKHEVLNISLNLLITEAPIKVREESYWHVSKLYLEGLYDQDVRKLYLIGCRKVDFDRFDLERGLDCLIEVTIEYSPENTRWLINPTAKISIVSQRNKDDVYHFNPIRLHTSMIHDRNHEKNVIFRKFFQGYLRVFLLVVYVAHILNQMRKMKKSPDVVYISLVMLGSWIIGYSISLIYDKEILIRSSESHAYMNQPYDLHNHKLHLNTLDYFARFLLLVSVFLMARISQMVWRGRQVLDDEGKSTPSEKKVLLVTLGVYMFHLLLNLIVGGLYLNPVKGTEAYMKLTMDVLKYEVHAVQNRIMLPQIIAFLMWRPRPSRPLLRSFFIGLCIPTLVQSAYEIVRDPVLYSSFMDGEVMYI